MIPDEATALTIGIAILTAYYGKDIVDRFRPYRVASLQENWAVMGTSSAQTEANTKQNALGPDNFLLVRGGGAPEIAVSGRDSQVLSLGLSR